MWKDINLCTSKHNGTSIHIASKKNDLFQIEYLAHSECDYIQLIYCKRGFYRISMDAFVSKEEFSKTDFKVLFFTILCKLNHDDFMQLFLIIENTSYSQGVKDGRNEICSKFHELMELE